ncbi:MAG TPA: transposase [bacterium]|jgi:REP element-mobilizing transposase RayT
MEHLAARLRRKPPRHPAFDYAAPGVYFVTICTHGRDCCLSEIADNVAGLTDIGCVVAACWEALPHHYPHVVLDAFVIMPDHVHGLLKMRPPAEDFATNPCGPPVSELVRWFKTQSTKHINREGLHPTEFRWQRSFFDRVLRNRKELIGARKYIRNNPQRRNVDDTNC